MSVWNLLYKQLPITQEQIFDVEKAVGYKLPTNLKELLLEMNGDDWRI